MRGRAAGGERAGISIKIALPGLLEFATRPLPFSGRGGGAPALVGGLGVREQMSPHPLVTCRVRSGVPEVVPGCTPALARLR